MQLPGVACPFSLAPRQGEFSWPAPGSGTQRDGPPPSGRQASTSGLRAALEVGHPFPELSELLLKLPARTPALQVNIDPFGQSQQLEDQHERDQAEGERNSPIATILDGITPWRLDAR